MALLILRGLVGFGLGSSSVPFDLLAEFLPSSHRGRFLIYIEYFWTVGSVMVAGSAWVLLSRYDWRILTYITAIPVSISCLGSIPLLPESPRWLLTQGRVKEAEDTIFMAAEINRTPIQSRLDLKPVSLQEEREPASTAGILSSSNLKILLPLCVIWCCYGMSYYATILFNGDVSSESDDTNDDTNDDDNGGRTCSFNYPPIFYCALSEVVGCTIVAVIIEKWGRVKSQVVLYSAGALGALGMGLFATSNQMTLFAVMSAIARLGVFSASAGTWVHTPELFRTEFRATGHACANAMAQVGSAMGPYIVYSLGNFEIGLLIALLNGACVIGVLMLPETAGKQVLFFTTVYRNTYNTI